MIKTGPIIFRMRNSLLYVSGCLLLSILCGCQREINTESETVHVFAAVSLKEAIEELKIEHFQELYPDHEPTKKEVQIDTDLEILFPDTYINNVQERLSCYQSLNEVTNQSALDQLVVELKDRFGPLPTTSKALIQSVQMKWIATELHFEKVVLKKNKLICYFDTTSTDNFFQSDDFSRMMKQLQSHSKKGILKERKQGENNRLLLSFEEVKTIEEALCCLAELQPTTV